MRRRFAALMLVVAVMGAAVAVAANPAGGSRRATVEVPPVLFRELVAAVGKAGFHRNTSEKRWQGGDVCRASANRDAYVCKRRPKVWVSSIVADGDSDVVQELWVFETGSAAEAARVKASLERDFHEFGPFGKHPYTIHVSGTSVLAVEGRFRWHTAGKQLDAAVKAFLDARGGAGARTP